MPRPIAQLTTIMAERHSIAKTRTAELSSSRPMSPDTLRRHSRDYMKTMNLESKLTTETDEVIDIS